MTPKARAPIGMASPVRTVHRLDDLDAIFDDAIDGVIWDRSAPPRILSQLKASPPRDLPDGRYRLTPQDVGGGVAAHFQVWGWPADDARHWIAEDVAALGKQISHILSASHLQVRIELVSGDACRKFHRDRVRARLICTYTGQGTEFGVVCGEEDTTPQHIEMVPTGSPIVLKGKLWSGSAPRRIVHRSPPIGGTGASRLVVVIDEAPPTAR